MHDLSFQQVSLVFLLALTENMGILEGLSKRNTKTLSYSSPTDWKELLQENIYLQYLSNIYQMFSNFCLSTLAISWTKSLTFKRALTGLHCKILKIFPLFTSKH